MALIEFRDVRKEFPAASRKERPVLALDDVTLDIAEGEITGVIGYSGAGKSTLVRLINALEQPTSGTVTVDGTLLTGQRDRALRAVRTNIGMIFQQFNLFRSRTVWGNIAYPLQVAKVPKSEHQRRISELLHFVGLTDKAHAYPSALSGGQKQRVGIARALATSPKVLLADESTSALDPETTDEMLALLQRINAELGVTIVVITHEMAVVKAIADSVVVMDSGRVVEHGRVLDVFARPQQPVTQRFVRSAVHGAPTDEQLAQLRSEHGGRIARLALRDPQVGQADVFADLAARGVRFEVVHGGVDEVAGSTFGNLTLSLRGSDADIDAAIAAHSALTDASGGR
ncbi:methionine ABC transporter ATP-binding protein [Saccharomonospora sp. CUA-673]|uniref:methionine ABC transporter ATP-binding protein n=1 Tax=Saccharomonospora sp. CUA-673 TaxID=1904969 RepID=UPI0009622541|nr:methionine ABC transporter ATP-binding protein [Saccharomonospora sp. CUA-673]OLT47027.1 methionine ABC transporter ATP-binding protein [Saccharomonospora sp. CUA-673]